MEQGGDVDGAGGSADEDASGAITQGDRGEVADGDAGAAGHDAGEADGLEGAMEEGCVGVSIAYFQCKICFERRIQTVRAVRERYM